MQRVGNNLESFISPERLTWIKPLALAGVAAAWGTFIAGQDLFISVGHFFLNSAEVLTLGNASKVVPLIMLATAAHLSYRTFFPAANPVDLAQLRNDVAQMRSDVTQLQSKIEQLVSDVGQIKQHVHLATEPQPQ